MKTYGFIAGLWCGLTAVQSRDNREEGRRDESPRASRYIVRSSGGPFLTGPMRTHPGRDCLSGPGPRIYPVLSCPVYLICTWPAPVGTRRTSQDWTVDTVTCGPADSGHCGLWPAGQQTNTTLRRSGLVPIQRGNPSLLVLTPNAQHKTNLQHVEHSTPPHYLDPSHSSLPCVAKLRTCRSPCQPGSCPFSIKSPAIISSSPGSGIVLPS